MITKHTVADSMKAVRANTIQIAKDIPAEKYDFRAAPESRSVLEYFRDILRITEFVVGVALHPQQVSFAERPRDDWRKEFVKTDLESLTTPEQVVTALESSSNDLYHRITMADDAFLNETILAPDDIRKVRLWMINTAKEQEMVLRGQLLLIERMLGIVPHTTRRQQELERLKAQRAQ